MGHTWDTLVLNGLIFCPTLCGRIVTRGNFTSCRVNTFVSDERKTPVLCLRHNPLEISIWHTFTLKPWVSWGGLFKQIMSPSDKCASFKLLTCSVQTHIFCRSQVGLSHMLYNYKHRVTKEAWKTLICNVCLQGVKWACLASYPNLRLLKSFVQSLWIQETVPTDTDLNASLDTVV